MIFDRKDERSPRRESRRHEIAGPMLAGRAGAEYARSSAPPITADCRMLFQSSAGDATPVR
jgi:hypothetical protein